MPFDPLAAAALLISLVSLGFSIEGRWHDRHKLRCVARMSTTYGPGQETYEIRVDVTNLGRRPVSVVDVQYKDNEEDLNDGQYAIRSPIYGGILDKGVPIELAENQTRSFSTSDLTRAGSSRVRMDPVKTSISWVREFHSWVVLAWARPRRRRISRLLLARRLSRDSVWPELQSESGAADYHRAGG